MINGAQVASQGYSNMIYGGAQDLHRQTGVGLAAVKEIESGDEDMVRPQVAAATRDSYDRIAKKEPNATGSRACVGLLAAGLKKMSASTMGSSGYALADAALAEMYPQDAVNNVFESPMEQNQIGLAFVDKMIGARCKESELARQAHSQYNDAVRAGGFTWDAGRDLLKGFFQQVQVSYTGDQAFAAVSIPQAVGDAVKASA